MKQLNLINLKTKRCSKCREVKSVSEFYKLKNNKFGNYCKICLLKYQKEYRQKNKKTIKKYHQKYYKNNSEKMKEYSKKYQKNNPEKIRKYLKKTSHRNWASHTRRDHKSKGYKIDISIDELEVIAKESKYCAICDIELDWGYGNKKYAQNNSPSLDRTNNEKILNKDNIQIVCRRCNSTKQDRTMNEFIEYCTKISNKFNQI